LSLFNLAAESGVLAAYLRNPEQIDVINDIGLEPNDFSGPQQRLIADVIRVVGPDVPLILERIPNETNRKFVEELSLTPVSVEQGKEYATVVKGLSVNRKIGNIGADIITVAQENRSDWRSALVEVDKLYRSLESSMPEPERSPRPADILARMGERFDQKIIPINWSRTLNYKTGGLRPNMYWVIGGFSSTGKSAVACNMALDVVNEPNHKVMIVSAEMSQEQYMIRLLSIMSGVSQYSIRDRVTVGLENDKKLKQARNRIANSNLLVYDDLYTMDMIRSEAKRVKQREGLDVLMIDFHQNITVTGDEMKDAREVAIQLQRLAKEIEVCVVDFSQVSNAMAQQDADPTQRTNDFYSFKGSGAIRDAADVAIMLRRDRNGARPNDLEFQIAKNRHGDIGRFTTHMELTTGKIVEPDEWGNLT
jgi:replicative DNA helicase